MSIVNSHTFKQPKVAIIVPIFNVENFLNACLQSCQNQTYKNLQIIMVDDSSSDSCFDIALDFVKKDSRFVLIKKPNGGLSSARNVGLDFLFNELNLSNLDSKKLENIEYNIQDSIKIQKGYYIYKGAFNGAKQENEAISLNKKQEIFVFSQLDSKDMESNCEYLHFLDSDDELALECIETCMQKLSEFIESNHKDSTLLSPPPPLLQHVVDLKNITIWHDFCNINESGKRFDGGIIKRNSEFMNNDILQNTQLLDYKASSLVAMCWNMLFPLESFRKNRIRFLDFVHSEDQLFSFMILTNLQNIIFLENELYKYRIRAGSMMNFNAKAHTPPPYKAELLNNFKDVNIGNQYYLSYSFLIMGASLWDFSELDSNLVYKIRLQNGVKFMLRHRCVAIRCIAINGKDPKNCLAIFKRMKARLPKGYFKFSTLFAFYFPKIQKIVSILLQNIIKFRKNT